MYKSLHKRKIPRKSLYKKKNKNLIGYKKIYINYNKKPIKNVEILNHYVDKIFTLNFQKIVYLSFITFIIGTVFIFLNTDEPKEIDIHNNDQFESLIISQEEVQDISISNTTTTIRKSDISPSTSTTTSTIFIKKIENVKDAQEQLKILYIYQGKIDGVNGSNTKLAIREFQKRSGLKIDGVLGPNTKNALERGSSSYVNTDYKEFVLTNSFKYSDENLAMQDKLAELNIYSGDSDGVFGYQTLYALKEFQKKAGLVVDGIYGPNTKNALDKGEDSYIKIKIVTNEINDKSEDINVSTATTTTSSTLTVDLINYNPNANCIAGYVNEINIWVPDPCFYPVFVFRYGSTAQVNSQEELDAYLNQNWSLTKEKTYSSLGSVPTQNYTDGYNSPVNGLPMPSGSNNSIVIGIKNDNNVRARPQSGPQNADAVFEVLVEGGMTRFINIFYQSDTNYHGPIRSARPTDPTVLRPLGGVLVASGATGGLIPEIRDMGVPVITDTRPEYFRITSRSAPHNLYADTFKLKTLAINRGYKKYNNPQPLFPWGDPSLINWTNNSYLTLTFSSYTTTTWNWNGSTYTRSYYDAYKNNNKSNPHNWIDENNNRGQITTSTVIALFCEPYIHPLQLPSVKTVGEGRAIILHQGKLLDAKWKRGSNVDPFHIVDNNDNILYIPKGKVWISLVPNTKNPSFG